MCWFSDLIVWLSAVVTAAATFVIAVFTVFLTRVGSLQTKILKTQTRAFVFIDGFDFRLYPLDSYEEPGTQDLGNGRSLEKALIPTYFSVQPRWRNSGSTPTKDMTINVSHKLLDGGLKPDFTFGYRYPEERHFVGPNSIQTSKSIEMGIGAAMEVIKVECRIPGSSISHPLLIIWGRADYRDVFDKPHFVEWCYRIGFARAPGQKLSAAFTQWGEYNRTDEDA
jgi:hypothetical protein